MDELPIKVGKSEKQLDILYWPGLKLLLNSLDLFVLYVDVFWEYHIAETPNFVLMKSIFLQVGI